MEFKKAFDYIVGKVEEELVKQNYTKQKVVAENDNELDRKSTRLNFSHRL